MAFLLLLIVASAFFQGGIPFLSAKTNGISVSNSAATSPRETNGIKSISPPGFSLALSSYLLSNLSNNDETFGCHHPQAGPLPSWECGQPLSSTPLLSGPLTVALLSITPAYLLPLRKNRFFDRPRNMIEATVNTPDRPPTPIHS